MAELQMPIANKAAAKRVKAGQAVQVQQQLKAAGATPTGPGAIQTAAAGFAGQQAQADVAGQAAENARIANTAQQGFQQETLRTEETNLQKQAELETVRAETEVRLAEAGRDIESKLLDKELSFNEITREAEFANERQLADYMAMHAKDEEDFKNKSAEMIRASDAKIHTLERANEVLLKNMTNEFKSGQAKLDRATQDRIRKAQAVLAAKIAKEKKKNNQIGKAIGAVKIVAGVAIAAYSGGTASAAGGAVAASGASDLAGGE